MERTWVIFIMFKKFLQTFKELKNYLRTPEFVSLFTILVLTVLVLGVNIAFAPGVLAVIMLLVFFGVGVVVINGYLRLAKLSAEAGLKTLEFRAATENLKDGIIIYDTDFKILNLNRAAEEILEVKAHDVIGKKITPQMIRHKEFKTLTQVLFPTLAPSLTELSPSSWPQIVRLELEDPPLLLHTTLNRLLNIKGEVIGFIKVIRDETREKEVMRAKNEFISVAAHQLRTPLTALAWSLENLSRNLSFSEKPELLETLKTSRGLTERMLKIVNDLLDAARIEEGKFGYKFEDIELVEFINRIITHIKPVAEEHDINITFNAPSQKYKVRADPNRLGIALTNLLDNAVRYNTKGGGVNLELEETGDRKRFVRIKISDNGIGISQEDLGKIFKKFHRGSNASQVEPNGSGLGLYITKNIVKRHGGDIGVESQLRRGSTFWFTLPLDPSFVPEKEVVYEE